MKLGRTMKAQSPKNKEKERNNNNNKEKKEVDLGQARGHSVIRRIPVGPEDMQQDESTSRP